MITLVQNLPVFLLALGIIVAALSGVGVAMLRRYAERQQVLIDIPNERSSHTRPKPRGGGVVIVLITLVGIAVLWMISSLSSPTLPTIFICGGVIALVGWIDDVRSLSATLRLAIQVVCAIVLVMGIGYFQAIQLGPNILIPIGVFGIPLTVIWIVGLINAYNFMDGIDGIAGGQAVVGGLTWVGIGLLETPSSMTTLVAVIGLLIAASSAGFLWHNWQPSRIIMGDVGATFLGYIFAVLPLLFDLGSRSFSGASMGLWISVLALWAFLADTGITMVRRALRHENILQAHRSHFYQRLVIGGWSHASVSLLYIAFAALGSMIVLWLA